jgi:hypothetical protein
MHFTRKQYTEYITGILFTRSYRYRSENRKIPNTKESNSAKDLTLTYPGTFLWAETQFYSTLVQYTVMVLLLWQRQCFGSESESALDPHSISSWIQKGENKHKKRRKIKSEDQKKYEN